MEMEYVGLKIKTGCRMVGGGCNMKNEMNRG